MKFKKLKTINEPWTTKQINRKIINKNCSMTTDNDACIIMFCSTFSISTIDF